MVGVNTLCPFFSRRSDTRRQHQPPCQAPCTSTKVLPLVCACAAVSSIMLNNPARSPPGCPTRCGGSVRFHSSSSPPSSRYLQQHVGEPARSIQGGCRRRASSVSPPPA